MAEINTIFKATVLQLKQIIFFNVFKKRTQALEPDWLSLIPSSTLARNWAKFFSLFRSQLLETDGDITHGVGLMRMK